MFCLTIIGSATVCQGQLFTSRSAWQSAAPDNLNLDFTTAAPPPNTYYTVYPSPAGVTLSGINFRSTSLSSPIAIISGHFCCTTYNRGFDQLASVTGGSGIQATLNYGTRAVGFDLFTVNSGDYGGTVPGLVDIVAGGQSFTVATPVYPNSAFFGFISATPLNTITITPRQTATGTQVDVMNFSFGSTAMGQTNVGFFQASGPTWALDSNGSGAFDAGDKVFHFAGQPGAIAVAGDWNGDGHSKVGYYLNGFWVLDYNGNGVYDGTGPGGDKFYAFGGGDPSYVPLIGDWNGDGRTKVGYYRNGFWALDTNGNGTFDGTGPGQDNFYGFGGNGAGEVPLLGDWNGDHRTKVGYFYQGNWVLDYDGNGLFTAADKDYTAFPYSPGDKAVFGDWCGDGKTKIGIYRNGFWILDFNGNGTYDGIGPGQDKFYGFGGNAGEIRLVGDWNGSGTSKIGIYVNGFWVLGFNGNGTYDGTVPGGVRFIPFGGASGYQPIIGRW